MLAYLNKSSMMVYDGYSNFSPNMSLFKSRYALKHQNPIFEKMLPGNNISNSNFSYVKEDETNSNFQFKIGTLPPINIENTNISNNNFKILGIRMTFWGNVTLPSSTCKTHSNVLFPH